MSNILTHSPFKRFSRRAQKALDTAIRLAREAQSPLVDSVTLLSAIYADRGSVGSAFLKKIGLSENDLSVPTPPKTTPKNTKENLPLPPLSEPLKRSIVKSYALAQSANSPYVGTEHLTHALLQSADPAIRTLLQKVGQTASFDASTLALNGAHEDHALIENLAHLPEFGVLSGAHTNEDTSAIDQFCDDMRQYTKDHPRETHVGRESEITQLIHILGRKKKNNILLVGDPGVGKTALVTGLMQRILSGNVPASLADTVIYELDLASVVAGTSFRGEFEERLKAIVEEASEDPNILLFIDEIHTIVGAGNGGGALDAANILKPALARGTLRCIGATTPKEYKKYIEKDGALSRRFQTISLGEPNEEETEKILEGIAPSLESFHRVRIESSAIRSAVRLGKRFFPDRFFPDKAIDILDSACSAKRAETPAHPLDITLREIEQSLDRLFEEKRIALLEESYDRAEKIQKEEQTLLSSLKETRLARSSLSSTITVTESDVQQSVANISGIPLSTVRLTLKSRLTALEKTLKQTLVGQNHSTHRIMRVLTRSGMGLSRASRPIASFLLLGPTGVGKTFTAKLIAKHFFENKNACIRVDMSEFRERHTVSGLLGAPAGYVGYGEGGTLTEKVRRHPHSLVLFDEVEKAHPDVLNILLQILEEGTLTDAEGKQISFAETIIVLTANIGSSELFAKNTFGFESANNQASTKNLSMIEEKLRTLLPEHIKPEILARLDDVLVLSPLDEKALRTLVAREIVRVKKALKTRGVTLSSDRRSIGILTKQSSQKNEGARAVRKVIEESVENEIADILLKNPETQSIRLAVRDEKLVFSKQKK